MEKEKYFKTTLLEDAKIRERHEIIIYIIIGLVGLSCLITSIVLFYYGIYENTYFFDVRFTSFLFFILFFISLIIGIWGCGVIVKEGKMPLTCR